MQVREQLRVSWFPDAFQTFGLATRRQLSDQALDKLEDGGITFIERNVDIRQLKHIIDVGCKETSR